MSTWVFTYIAELNTHLYSGIPISVRVTRQEDVATACTCKTQFYIILPLSISILCLVIFAVLHSQKLKMCRGHLFSNAVKLMPFISDIQYYVPIKLCKTEESTESIHLFKITGILVPENVKLKTKLYLGYSRHRLEEGQHDIKWK